MKNRISNIRRSWSEWSQGSINRQIFGATLIVGGLTGCVYVVTFLKELVIAHRFGTSDDLDAFLIAFLLPSISISVFAASLTSAFIPTYVSVKEKQGEAAAQDLFSSISVWSLAVLGLVCVVLGLSIHVVLPHFASGFSGGKIALTSSLFFILLPVLLVSGVATLWSSILNATQQFVVAAIAPASVSLVTIASLLFLEKRYGVYALALGTLGGFCVQMAVLFLSLQRRKIPLRPKWNGMSPETKAVVGQYLPTVAGAFLMSGTGLVDKSMAAMLGSGSVSVLSYGNKVVSFFLGVGATALGTAVLPHFSRLVAMEDWAGIRHTLKTYICLVLLATIPLVVFLMFFSETIIKFVFERGRFTHVDTILVARVQVFYLLQVPFYILGILFVRLVSSFKKNNILLWGAAISFPVNILLNALFMKWMGIAGIALSTSVVYLISCVYLGSMLLHCMRAHESQSIG